MTATVLERARAALFLLTLPLWFLPLCLIIGYIAGGGDILREIPPTVRLVFRGIRP